MCSCAPERCHGDSIAKHVRRGLEAGDAGDVAAAANAAAAEEEAVQSSVSTDSAPNETAQQARPEGR